MVICLLLFMIPIYGGNVCKSFFVTKVEDVYESKENEQMTKQQIIQNSVENLPLPHVIMIHLRAHTVDFKNYEIASEDVKYFRDCVAKRFNENSDDIDKLLGAHSPENPNVVSVPASQVSNFRRLKIKAKSSQENRSNSPAQNSGDISKIDN